MAPGGPDLGLKLITEQNMVFSSSENLPTKRYSPQELRAGPIHTHVVTCRSLLGF